MVTNAIVTTEQRAIEQVTTLANIIRTLRADVLKAGTDYGVIPGTGDKPTLLLPGMEKLMRALRLRPEYVLLTAHEDFDKPLFHYRYECRMVEVDSGLTVSTAIGSANSYEGKWRYRKASRVCPSCGKDTIIKGKAEYGGGWICFAKKGGCGAKFAETAKEITDQPEGRQVNEDIFDQINTIDKIAQKRALSSAIKGAANVSEFFTVDLDDLKIYDHAVIEAEYEELPVVTPPAPQKSNIPPLMQHAIVETEKGTFAVPTGPILAPAFEEQFPKSDAPPPFKKTKRDLAYEETNMRHNYGHRAHFDKLMELLQREDKIHKDMALEELVDAIDAHYAAKAQEKATA